jgi:hypothetical protein
MARRPARCYRYCKNKVRRKNPGPKMIISSELLRADFRQSGSSDSMNSGIIY